MLKILTVGEFDPAGVHLRHRRWLRQLGVDYRLAVRDIYRAEGVDCDYWYGDAVTESAGDRLVPLVTRRERHRAEGWRELNDFARVADIVQLLPSIGAGWSHGSTAPRFDDAIDRTGPINWATVGEHARRVALFHGSANAAANAELYAEHYHGQGWTVAATTLDYAYRMGAAYLPAIVDAHLNHEHADERAHGERLRVVATPTDMAASGTAEFRDVVETVGGLEFELVMNRDHATCLARKRHAHVGFDHVRGAFSVNSLENAALGLANLVAVRSEYRPILRRTMDTDVPWPSVESMSDVADNLVDMRDSVDVTVHWQRRCSDWMATAWHPLRVADHLLAAYKEIARA